MNEIKTYPKILFFPLEISLSALAFTIPFFISGPQWLTGTLVNSFLFIFVARSYKKILPVVVLPSIGAFFHGVVFGPLTFFLFYFLPFIWIGNYFLVLVFQKTSGKLDFFSGVLVSALVKSFFLFFTATLFFKLNIVPKLFLTTMGFVQFATALAGGFLSYFVIFLMKKYDRA